MSLDGKLSHLQIVVNSSLLGGSGLRINPTARGYQGTYPRLTDDEAGWGTLVFNTFLKDLTRAIPLAYAIQQSGSITAETYRNLISIGQGVSEALGNSIPPTFNQTPSGWVSSWPNGSNGYNYSVYGANSGDLYLNNGFLATVARQAYYEFYSASGTTQYSNTIKSLLLDYAWKGNRNNLVGTYVNSKTYLSNTYGGINDLTSAGVSSVNSDFKNFGNDLIRSGKVIDLLNITKFGTPSVLIKTLGKYGAITGALGLLMILNGLTGSEVRGIASGNTRPTAEQEKKIYDSLYGVIGEDLDEVKTIMNISTDGLTNLADLLNPLKLFPNSYTTLTAPIYQDPYTNGGVNKQLVNIYSGSGVNTRLPESSYLVGILPDDIARASGAFGDSMTQINNIMQMQIERISQSISNLQAISGSMLMATSSIGNSLPLVSATLDSIAKGGGSNGTYRMADFFGAMSGVTYNLPYELLSEAINGNADTFSTLGSIYTSIYNLIITTGPYTDLQTLIDQANAEIQRIANANSSLINQINTYWGIIGNNLYREQLAIITAIPDLQSVTIGTTALDDYQSFVSSFDNYILESGAWEIKEVLIAIADVDTQGGQALVAALTEAQNAAVLAPSGAPLNNGIPPEVDPQQASAKAILDGSGKITAIQVTNGGTGYNKQSCACCMPSVSIEGGLSDAEAIVDMDLGIVTGVLLKTGTDVVYTAPPAVIIAPAAVPPPLGSSEPGSFAGNPFTGIISDNLRTPS